ncbi:hypothetical protein GIB67_016173 [Kingdonia uniflora]|uniref:RNase H type-1 domain-containing protein n=1 Tax=Kingdonia uniflora TaxID=39325 RepID=A0A7J7N9R2_9MAGN|nr:hypothetical protein GIB67_016173 [Kingdonia uniflora]
MSGAGGIIRNNLGKLQLGYNIALGHGTNTATEMFSLLHGLMHCKRQGWLPLIIEVDAELLVKYISTKAFQGSEMNKTTAPGEIAEYPNLSGLQLSKKDQVMETSSLHGKIPESTLNTKKPTQSFVDMVRGRTDTPAEATSLLDVGMRGDTPLVSIPIGEIIINNTNNLIWYKFLGLPSELWSQKIAMSLGKTLGTPIHLDRSIINHDYGYHASVLVDIDLSNPIPNHVFIDVEGKLINQEILLFRVPKFCNHCKNVGHNITKCKVIQRVVCGEQKQVPKAVKKPGTTKSTGNSNVAPRKEGVQSKPEMGKNFQGPLNTHTYFSG